MRLISALLVRNEAGEDRYLRRVLRRCREFSDAIVVLDDQSSDQTPKVCAEFGCIVKQRGLSLPAWGNEASAREELWNLALSQCTDAHSWVLINDADQEMVGNPRELCLSLETNAWAMTLFDCWSDTEYREDQFWQAHMNPRPWLFAPLRVPQGWAPEWPARGIHPGHCPINYPLVCGIAPPEYHWLHYAYSTPEARVAKHRQYASQFHLMSAHERAHAESIIQ